MIVRHSVFHHGEHIILLSRERVNNGRKRTNSLPLSPVAISSLRDFTGKTAAYKTCIITAALNSYLVLSVLSKIGFGLYLRNRKHVPCFYRVIQTGVEVWENEKCCGNTSRRRVFPQKNSFFSYLYLLFLLSNIVCSL